LKREIIYSALHPLYIKKEAMKLIFMYVVETAQKIIHGNLFEKNNCQRFLIASLWNTGRKIPNYL
jgi:hypothetical protein